MLRLSRNFRFDFAADRSCTLGPPGMQRLLGFLRVALYAGMILAETPKRVAFRMAGSLTFAWRLQRPSEREPFRFTCTVV
jgi:hypothetical protein